MGTKLSTGRVGANRRQFLGVATVAFAATTAEGCPAAGFAIFDPRPVFGLAEELFPGRGEELNNQWRTRQFEYIWRRNSMGKYADSWRVTEDSLSYAAQQSKLELTAGKSSELMSAYLQMKPGNDVVAVLEALRKRGLRLALLANLTPTMVRSCVTASGLHGMFEFELSTDSVRAFKPVPAAYAMGIQAYDLEKRRRCNPSRSRISGEFPGRPESDVMGDHATSREAPDFKFIFVRRRFKTMKLSRYGYSGIVLAAWLLQPSGAFTQDRSLTLTPGIYVREPAQCKGAPNAAIMSWNGATFSGPHSSQCKSVVVHKNGTKYEISTTCSALGDGSPNPSGTPYAESFVLTRSSSTQFTITKHKQREGVYRWCGARVQD